MFRVAACCAFLLVAGASYAADSAPGWVQEISGRSIPTYSGRVPAAVLLNEEHVTVDASGKTTVDFRKAIKILNQEGRADAHAAIPYFNGSGKVKELHAWVVAPGGFTKSFGKESIADVGAVGEDLYNDLRMRVVHVEEPEVGAVFAYEAELEQKTLFGQDQYYFQDDLPAVRSRYVLTLPAGWTASAVVFNHAPLQPVVDGTTYSWELDELPFRMRELAGPVPAALTPRLTVSFFSRGNANDFGARGFKSWSDASEWLTELISGQDTLNEEMNAKVRELTASASNEYQKIQAIGHYVQQLKYVSIQMNLARGGGYKPHAASAVFQKQYGDCKDKANLMRALLKAAGIQSYLVALYAGDRTLVREEWPSPQQFNHAIIAVRISNSTQTDTVITHPELGRLLIFDPTSEITPIGDLPAYEQGSFGLLVAGDKGSLVRLPITPPDSNLTDVSIEGSLSEAGQLKASMTDRDHGQPAASLRGSFRSPDPGENRKLVEHWLNYTNRTVQVEKIEPQDVFAKNEFNLGIQFAADNYGQLMQGRLLMFKPSVIAPRRQLNFREELRKAPIVLYAETYRTQVRIKLPEGFAVDEMPEGGKLDTAFGHFTFSYKVSNGELLATQELKTEAVTLPAEDYPEVRKFFGRVHAAEQQPVVLVRN